MRASVKRVAGVAALACLATAGGSGAAAERGAPAGNAVAVAEKITPAENGVAAAEKITPAGAGAVRLGMTAAELRERGLVGRLRPGCELAGPGARTASLRRPLKGTVDFTTRTPRRARNIAVRGGGTARGVGIGASRAAVRAAFPKARFDRSTEELFEVTLVRIPKGGGGRLQMAIDVNTRKVTVIAVPYIAFCE